jgi:hypothetical protein
MHVHATAAGPDDALKPSANDDAVSVTAWQQISRLDNNCVERRRRIIKD